MQDKMSYIPRLLTALLLGLASLTECFAQWVWHDPLRAGQASYIHGQGWDEDGGNYHRLPDRAQAKVRDKVWQLACQSAGLSLRFRTDARELSLMYQTTQPLSMPHMPSTGVSGVDLYRAGDLAFCFGSYSFGDTIRYSYRLDSASDSREETEYILYLPLYNEVSRLEIGVPTGSSFAFVPAPQERPIVLYRTSIAQGACASRPGMAWANILGRELGQPLINLGFSGNGKLEEELISLIAEQRPSLVILDCMPNMGGFDSDEIIRRLKAAVHRLSALPDLSILLIEHAGNSNALTDQAEGAKSARSNQAQREAYRQLQSEGLQGLYYLSREELGLSPDTWVDYVHPSDLGMRQYASAVLHKIKALQGAKALASRRPAAPPQQPRSKNYSLGTAQLSPRSSNIR